MRRTYLCIIAKGTAFASAFREAQIARMATRTLDLVYDRANVLLFATPDLPFRPLISDHGLVLGDLFGRTTGTPAEPPANAKDVVSLLERYWGSYIALFTVHHPTLLRDPGGGLACFTTSDADAFYYASCVDELTGATATAPRIDWSQLCHRLHFSGVRTRRTALADVEEVLPGCAVQHEMERSVTHTAWTPWDYTGFQPSYPSDSLKSQVRRAVDHSVTAWSRVSQNILIELSGGLDSSIVAASLIGRKPQPHCANLVTPGGGADERRYAQPMADTLGVALHTLPLLSEPVELPHALAVKLPLPGVGVLQSAVDVVLAAEARRIGATDFFSGGGGDNVFCYLHTAAPATDALRTFGLSAPFFQAVRNLSHLHECSYWTALRLAAKKHLKSSRRVPKSNGRFLATDEVPAFQVHPWMDAPKAALPGKFEHVLALIRAQNLYDLQERTQLGPIRYPLLSQPVMEACLAVPSWMWIDQGRNRSLARDAFADRLPPLVAGRRTKGEFTGFCGEVYETHKPFLRHYLLGGLLAEHRLIDTQAIEAYLTAPTPARDIGFCVLLDLAGVETWCRQW
ncbi:asparagine synthase C-terminal domain-containing protein [Asticcacaulis sp. YBE204]|uniref:asparagine synthase-related protein n=1 Tax=Asticcacaulis sp. YBE204 TaxID=1282363 RepID=UPI0003C3E3A5|nr:asparagine synthase C-terminal domain-containing protein [Asticcacaulis sp. YBE204]ESQ78678.1 hypothetical protein AEYBE204_11885 [Asticcacaulis sp. YBE204]